ncbi:MAG: hypothetical protein IPK32_12915 [Verrucomicrobiaceae bacterium]|nr:hypothetical protein [Verrucomicrobiaceae bacterium]
MNSFFQLIRDFCRRMREGKYRVGSTLSRFIARDVKREVEIVGNSRLSEGYVTVKMRTTNLLYEAGGLVPKSEFGPPTEIAINELWRWTGASWGGLPDKTSIVGTHLLDTRPLGGESRSFAREVADMIARAWPRIALYIIAPPVFAFFPVAAALLFMSGKQLIWGFDDMPLVAMFLGLLVGGGIALPALGLVIRVARRGKLQTAWIITLVAATFDCAAIPLASHIIDRVEHPDRYQTHSGS